MNSILLLSLTVGFLVCHHSHAEPLTDPPVLTLNTCGVNGDRKCATIEFIPKTFTISTPQTTTFTTRVYKDGADDELGNVRLGAGPSLIAERGVTYEITLINELGASSPDNPVFGVDILNGYNGPNITSLHTHGCHISPEAPADFVLIDVGPGGQHTYSYSIPPDHSGGMHWYHPHHHGSAALQVGGGAYAAFTIEDDQDADGLPDWYTNMSAKIAIIGSFDLQFLTGIFPPNIDYLTTGDPLRSFYLINGQYQPEIPLTQNTWSKLMFGHIDPVYDVEVEIDSVECTVYLLGKDGVLLADIPRLIPSNTLYFHQAGRAEIAISCDLNPGETVDIKIQNDVIGTFVMTGEPNSNPADTLPTFSPNRPAYLTSLIDWQGPWQQYAKKNGQTQDYFSLRLSAKTINGKKLSLGMVTGDWLTRMDANTPSKWEIGSSSNHPFHMHVHHVQVADDARMGPDGWTQQGDWLDSTTTNLEVRFWAGTWHGNTFIHCHNLPHEDIGAVAIAFVNGGCNADMTQSMDSENYPNNQCRFLDDDAAASYTSGSAPAQQNEDINGDNNLNTYDDGNNNFNNLGNHTFYEILSVNLLTSALCSSFMIFMVYWFCLRKGIASISKTEKEMCEHVAGASDASATTKQEEIP